jgi:isopentenyl-diphosphate delta-isomerase
MSNQEHIAQRKAAHLDICTNPSVYLVETGNTWLDQVSLLHNPLPEVNFDEINLSTPFLGKILSSPFFISSMTGGSEGGYQLNKDLARGAEELGIGVGMGSIRILFRKPEVFHHFELKKFAPNVAVFANIGSVQIRDMDHKEMLKVINDLGVDGLAIHLNPAQELFQPEGDRNFKGILSRLEEFIQACPIPIIVKETGCGIPRSVASKLISYGVDYIDIAGMGGTNWMRVEDYRETNTPSKEVQEFDLWGIPTGLNLGSYFPEGISSNPSFSGKILASGGLRSAMDGIKTLSLGASLFGMALPVAMAHRTGGYSHLIEFLTNITTTIKKACLLTGVTSIAQLQQRPLVKSSEFIHQSNMYSRG